jgi:hypothetical protein
MRDAHRTNIVPFQAFYETQLKELNQFQFTCGSDVILNYLIKETRGALLRAFLLLHQYQTKTATHG